MAQIQESPSEKCLDTASLELANPDESKTVEHPDETLIQFNGPEDMRDPKNWTLVHKWCIVGLLSSMALTANFAILICAPVVPDILDEFNSTNQFDATILVSIWNLGGVLGPLFVGPLSEIYGRLPVYNLFNIVFIVFCAGAALSKNIRMLIAFRFFNGLTLASSTLNSSIVADLFVTEQRGRVQSIMTVMPLIGPIAGPIVGGYLAGAEGWRWTFWLPAIMVTVVEIGFATIYRETYEPTILRREARQQRRKTGKGVHHSRYDHTDTPIASISRAMLRPLKVFTLPIFLLLSTCTSLIYGYIYLTVTTITEVFNERYSFSEGAAGLSFLGVGLGMAVGVFLCGATLDWYTNRMKAVHDGEIKPEWRLPPMALGGIIVPTGLFMYGWTAQMHVEWMAPIIGTAFLGFGLVVITIPVTTYLTDAFGIYRASAIAAMTVYRNVVSTVLPLAGPPMFRAIGLGWGNTILGLVALMTVPAPFLLLRFGEQLRKRSKIEKRLK
ncbi:hypothetical protein MMC25_008329 [Agyrium rufum]|nr:hypothetical protein [Agyrium rufum]